MKSSSTYAKDYMVSAVPKAGPDATIGAIETMIRKDADKYETLDYIYVVGPRETLLGIISIKRLFSEKEKKARASDIMEKKLVVARAMSHPEKVVYLAISRASKAIPIVGNEGQLLGVIPHDTILRIFNREAREDTFRFGGLFHKFESEFTAATSSLTMIKARLPWLILGVLGGTMTASIVTGFESVLEGTIALASFIPVLVYLSDAAGTQSEALIVRGLAVESNLNLGKYLMRELKTAGILGLICGSLLGLASAAGWADPSLGLAVGISMFLSLIAAVFLSTILPLLFWTFKQDPAVASGPFATLLSDIITLVIYFQVATIVLRFFSA